MLPYTEGIDYEKAHLNWKVHPDWLVPIVLGVTINTTREESIHQSCSTMKPVNYNNNLPVRYAHRCDGATDIREITNN